MAYPYVPAYPLSFPNEEQRTSISSYSSLAGALGTDPGYANRQQQRSLRTLRDAVTDTQAIYLDTPPVSNPLYPYPARNVVNPGTYLVRTPSSVPSKRHTSNASVVWSESSSNRDLSLMSLHWRLPRPFVEADGYQARARPSVIRFRRNGDKAPYSLWDLLDMSTMPDLVDGDQPLFVHNSGRLVRIMFIWPGYSGYPFEKRISTKKIVPFTPTLLLMELAKHVREFVRYIQSEGAVVEPGQERWRITKVPGGAPEMWKSCIITSLQHRGGCTWQPKIIYREG